MEQSHKCLVCKGRYPKEYCHNDFCPLYKKLYNLLKADEKILSDSFSSESRTPFVGRFNYPNVNLGVLAPAEAGDDYLYDSSKKWASLNLSAAEVIDLRSKLINSNMPVNVAEKSTHLQNVQEITIGKKPVDIDVTLEKRPDFKLTFTPDNAPYGPSAKLKEMDITSNAKVPKPVDKAVSDPDFRAVDAMKYLHEKGIDEDYLTRLFSVGLLGMQMQRKIVPTRWSITAVDDALGKAEILKLNDFKQSGYLAFFGGYLGNYYIIMLIPSPFRYELFEMIAGAESRYTTDYEGISGRKEYARATAGGYYAARLSIAEKMAELKINASVLALRFITEEYALPLGVWVVREATGKAMSSSPIAFSSLDLMLEYAKMKARKAFNTDILPVFSNSKLLEEIKNQKGLKDFV